MGASHPGAERRLLMPSYACERCECGGWKPKGISCCFRCEALDEEFQLIDTLIATGFGDRSREKIPAACIEYARKHPQRPPLAVESAMARSGPRFTRQIPPCPHCESKSRERCGTQAVGELLYRCRNCHRQYRIPILAQEAAAS
jgi:hypothetical protein